MAAQKGSQTAHAEERDMLHAVVDAARRFEMFAHLAILPKDSVGYEAFVESRGDLRAALSRLDDSV